MDKVTLSPRPYSKWIPLKVNPGKYYATLRGLRNVPGQHGPQLHWKFILLDENKQLLKITRDGQLSTALFTQFTSTKTGFVPETKTPAKGRLWLETIAGVSLDDVDNEDDLIDLALKRQVAIVYLTDHHSHPDEMEIGKILPVSDEEVEEIKKILETA